MENKIAAVAVYSFDEVGHPKSHEGDGILLWFTSLHKNGRAVNAVAVLDTEMAKEYITNHPNKDWYGAIVTVIYDKGVAFEVVAKRNGRILSWGETNG